MARAACVGSEDGTQESAAHVAGERGVTGEMDAKRPRQGEHPLPQGLIWQHVIGEVRGDGGHASAGAGGAKASALAGKRDELIEEAGGTAQAGEAEGGVAAADESEQFAGDVGGQGARILGAFGAV